MGFKKRRLNKALEDKIYRVKLVHGNKGWLTVGLTFITLFSASVLSTRTVDASAVNNVATANSTKSSFVQLYNSVTTNDMHKANRGLANGSQWKTARAVKGIDGEIYILVGGNEYANANQMDLADETSKQLLSGVVHVANGNGQYAELYTNPMKGAELVGNRALAKNSDWKTDQKVVVNGTTYYRVATNEWVKGSEATLTTENSRSDKTYTKNSPNEQQGDNGSTITDNHHNINTDSTNHNDSTTTTPVAKDATIVIHHLNEDGTQFAKDEIVTAKVGSTYRALAHDTEGYWTKGSITQNIVVKDGKNEVTFVYQKAGAKKVNIKYVDDKGNEIANSDFQYANIGSNVTVNAKTFAGYTLKGAASQTQKVSADGNTITFAYVKNATTTPTEPTDETATVTAKFVDENGKNIADAITQTAKVGSDVTANAKTIDGYTLINEAVQKQTVSKDGNTITFTYKSNATTPVDPDKGNEGGTTTPTDPETKTANVTVKYVDASGKEVATAKTLTNQKVGSTIAADAIDVEGYDLTSDKTTTTTVAEDNSSVITFTYKAKETAPVDPVEPTTATVTTKFVDDKGNKIADDKTDTVEIGKDFTAKAIDIDDYTIKGDTTQTTSVDGNKVITFTYTKNAIPAKNATITVKYQLTDGTTIHDDTTDIVKIGDKYTIEYPTINGYLPAGDTVKTIDAVSGDATLTFTYTDKAPLTVQLLSADTGYVVGNAIETKAKIGTKVTVDAPDVLGYDVTDATPQTVTISGKGGIYADTTVTFKYKKNAEKMKNVISQLNTEMFKWENKFRAEHNVPALVLDSNLQAGAEARAQQLVYGIDTLGRFIEHEQPDGSNFSEEPHLKAYQDETGGLGENIGFGGTYNNDISKWALQIFNLQIGDQEHYDNALDPEYKAGGFAVGISNNGTTFGVQDFGQDSSK